MARILIIGLGYLGQALAETFHQAGHQVTGIRRSPINLPGITCLSYDLGQTIPPLPEADYVYYLISADNASESAYQVAYIDALNHCLSALSRPPKHFFFISSTRVYHQNQGEWVDENSETLATHWAQTALLAGEKRCHQTPYPSTVIRFSGLYGPGRLGLINRLKNQQAYLSDTPIISHWIHRDDAVGILAHLLSLPSLEDCYLASDCTPLPRNTLLTTLADSLNLPTPLLGNSPPTHGGYRQFSVERLKASGYQWQHPNCLTSMIALGQQID